MVEMLSNGGHSNEKHHYSCRGPLNIHIDQTGLNAGFSCYDLHLQGNVAEAVYIHFYSVLTRPSSNSTAPTGASYPAKSF